MPVRRKTATKNLNLELALVRVRLVPAEEGGAVVASQLQVRLRLHEADQDRFRGMGLPEPGVSLEDGQREILLYLPANPTVLRVITNAGRLRAMPQIAGVTNPLGEAEITPKMGEINRVEIRVKAPPEIE